MLKFGQNGVLEEIFQFLCLTSIFTSFCSLLYPTYNDIETPRNVILTSPFCIPGSPAPVPFSQRLPL